jgi:Tfp pilus assembly protein PilF
MSGALFQLLGLNHLRLMTLPVFLLAALLATGLSGCASMSSDMPAFRPHPLVSDPQASYQYGRYLQNKGKHHWAVQELAKATAADPSHVQAYNAMGISYDILGEYAQAQEAYQAALDIDPDLAWVHNNLGVSALMQGQVHKAISSFSRAVELSPETVRFRNNLGLAYAQNGQMPKAFAQFSVAEGPAKAHARLATCYQQAGKTELAREHLARSYALESGSGSTEAMQQTFSTPDFAGSSETARGDQKHTYRAEVDTNRVVAAPVAKQKPPPGKVVRAKPSLEKEKKPRQRDVPAQPQTFANKDNTPDSLEEFPIQNTRPEPQPDSQPGIEISNGNGVQGMAARVGRYLSGKDLHVVRLSNADHFGHEQTMVYYCPEYLQQAYQVAQEIPGWQDMQEVEELDREEVKIKVRIGRDIVRHDGNQLAAL